MTSKIKLYHFHNGTGGGVLSVIKNLIKFSQNNNIEHHIIYTINKNVTPKYKIDVVEGASSQQIFYYSQHNNFYYTIKKLADFLSDNNSIIIAHDWLELGMASNLGLQNPVVQFLHGDYEYYYELAKKNNEAINLFIPIAENIKNNLLSILTNRSNDIQYLRFPVPIAENKNKRLNTCNIIFIGRLCKDKGYDLLPTIGLILLQNNIKVSWHIVGAKEDESADLLWNKNIDVKFYGPISNEMVLSILPEMTFILLPSKFEGMPIVLIEAMKAGIIPLASDINGGIQELIFNDITGFKLPVNDAQGYANKIIALNQNHQLKSGMIDNCVEIAERLFDPFQNTANIENCILKTIKSNKIKKPNKVYGSRLDNPLVPNFFAHFIRKYLSNK